MPDLPRLIVLPPSHYCERARWGLDYAGVAYTEERWAVGCHVPLARRIAPATTLPILVADNAVIQGSGRILDWAGVPGVDAELEERFDRRIGVLVRQYIYAATLSDSLSGVRDALLDGVSAAQARLSRVMWPVVRRLMIAGMDARPALLGKVEAQLGAELDWFDHRVVGRRYIVGDQLGRADITAASLLAPLVRPRACPLYRQVTLPARVEETLTTWSARPALQWARCLYAAHRP
ncbi:MAG TPA: glutathione S-transferase N-terminal domain-containing protein [Beijerinckiaceae bacterium]|nr:glutathione S-transferase N-terminal domain-containing protein [Beijerinckiaceae bacterium]